jgi:hypothetical protein
MYVCKILDKFHIEHTSWRLLGAPGSIVATFHTAFRALAFGKLSSGQSSRVTDSHGDRDDPRNVCPQHPSYTTKEDFISN